MRQLFCLCGDQFFFTLRGESEDVPYIVEQAHLEQDRGRHFACAVLDHMQVLVGDTKLFCHECGFSVASCSLQFVRINLETNNPRVHARRLYELSSGVNDQLIIDGVGYISQLSTPRRVSLS